MSNYLVERDFLVAVDSITSLVAHRGLDGAAIAELKRVSQAARVLYERGPAADQVEIPILALPPGKVALIVTAHERITAEVAERIKSQVIGRLREAQHGEPVVLLLDSGMTVQWLEVPDAAGPR